MKKLRKIGVGISAIGLALVASFFGQVFSSTHAANTLVATGSQVIEVATTDSLPPDAAVIVEDYSADGNVILFRSNATNLAGASGIGGLYTYNITTNMTARVDVSTSGVPANKAIYNMFSKSQLLSETGRYVLFMSKATNLMDGWTLPSSPDYYSTHTRDMQSGTTTMLANEPDFGYTQNHNRNLGISNDGRFVLMASRKIANSYPYYYRTVVGDGASGTYSWTSLGSGNNIEGSHGSTNTRGNMSCDGAFVTFNNSSNNVQLVDLRRGSTVTVDSSSGGKSSSPVISCNGRYVLYATTGRTQITPTPVGMNVHQHLVRYDRITGERTYIDSDSLGVFSNGYGFPSYPSEPSQNAFKASISDRGDVVFQYGNGGSVYLKHLSDGSGTLESVAMDISGNYISSTNGELTKDGRYIFLTMDPYNLGLVPAPAGSQIIRVKTHL